MKIVDNNIIIENVPLSAHTSKYRFKRKSGDFVDYLALQDDKRIVGEDYIEWQISYDLSLDNIYKTLRNGGDLSKLLGEGKPEELKHKIVESFNGVDSSLSIQKRKATFVEKIGKVSKELNQPIVEKNRGGKVVKVFLNELSDFVRIAYTEKIVSKKEIEEMLKFAEGTNINLDLEFNIRREEASDKKEIEGFVLNWEKYPLFIKKINDNFFVEIIKKHMQYAIGYQNMIYLCISASIVNEADGSSILRKEKENLTSCSFALSKEALQETLRAFVVASDNHRNDIIEILKTILKP